MNVKTMLEEELQSETEALARLEVGSEEYKIAVDGVTKLAGCITEIEKSERDADTKEQARFDDVCYKNQQIALEKKRDWAHIGLEIGKFIGYGAIYFAAFIMSTNFEREGTFTTEGGKHSIRELFKMKP